MGPPTRTARWHRRHLRQVARRRQLKKKFRPALVEAARHQRKVDKESWMRRWWDDLRNRPDPFAGKYIDKAGRRRRGEV